MPASSRAVALSSSRAPRRVSPNMMPIGVPASGVASCVGAALGLGDGVEALAPAVPAASSPLSRAPPQAESAMAVSSARMSVWRPRLRRGRPITEGDVVFTVGGSAGGVAAVDGQCDADDQARAPAAPPQDNGGDLVAAARPSPPLGYRGQCDADDQARARAAQPQDSGGDLVAAAEPSDRLVRDGVVNGELAIRDHGGDHRSLDRAGAYRVDPDAARRVLERGALGHSEDAVLGGVVGGASRVADEAAERRAVDYGATSLYAHLA